VGMPPLAELRQEDSFITDDDGVCYPECS
jgi:hypothetical protein